MAPVMPPILKGPYEPYGFITRVRCEKEGYEVKEETICIPLEKPLDTIRIDSYLRRRK